MSSTRQRSAWAAATAAGVLLAFAPAVAGVRTLSQRDTDQLYAPVRTLVVEELRAGRLPLWNPYEATGKPLFAEGIHGVLHPLSLLAAAVAPSSIDFLLLAYLVTAALGVFAVAWSLGASAPACAGAGLAYALSGYSASMTGNLVFLAGLSALPWIVAAARSAGAGARWGVVATALATGCAFLTGDAQAALVGVALGLLLAAEAGGRHGAARALAGVAAGLLLAGVQVAATQALIPRTYRSFDLEEIEKTMWSLDPGRLLEWVIPGLARGPLDETPVGAAPSLDRLVFAESVYLGAPLLSIAVLGVRAGGRRAGVLLAAAAGVLLWLALGHHLGARQLLDWVPVWSRFRYSEKLMAPLTLCVCVLGAFGIDALATGRSPPTWRRALAGAAVAAAGLLVVLLAAPGLGDAAAVRVVGEHGPFYRGRFAAGLPHVLGGLSLLLALDRLGPARLRAPALAALVALASAAAVRYGSHLGEPALRQIATPLRLESADTPVPRILHPFDRMRAPNDPAGPVDATARTEYTFLGEAVPVAHRIDTLEIYGAFEPRRYETLLRTFGPRWMYAFRRFGLTHLPLQAIPHADTSEIAMPVLQGGTLVQRDPALGLELWAVPHRPWAFFARRALPVSTAEARKVLYDLVATGDDTTVAIETAEAAPTAPGRVLNVQRGTGSVRLEAEALGPALLVVQDAWWPGWRATVDGRPVEILPADFLVRAVRFPQGRHVLEMTYDPPEVRLGLALSAAGAILVALLALRAWRTRPA